MNIIEFIVNGKTLYAIKAPCGHLVGERQSYNTGEAITTYSAWTSKRKANEFIKLIEGELANCRVIETVGVL